MMYLVGINRICIWLRVGRSGNTNLNLKNKRYKKGKKHFCFFHPVEISVSIEISCLFCGYIHKFSCFKAAISREMGRSVPSPPVCKYFLLRNIIFFWCFDHSFTHLQWPRVVVLPHHIPTIPQFWWENITVSLHGLFFGWEGGLFDLCLCVVF